MTPEEIRAARLNYPLTVQELADRLGVGHSTVVQWETGARTPWPKYMRMLKALFARRQGCRCECHGGTALRVPRRMWSRVEDDIIRTMVADGRSTTEISEHLRAQGRERTPRAISRRMNLLGVEYDTHLRQVDVCRMLGFSPYFFDKFVARGYLKAHKLPALKEDRPTHYWRVRKEDLEDFVRNHAGIEFSLTGIRDTDLRRIATRAVLARHPGEGHAVECEERPTATAASG